MTINANNRHKIPLILGAIAFIALGLFPPWSQTYDSDGHHFRRNAGYQFIATPPPPDAPAFGVEIDRCRLGVEWLCAIALAVGVALLLGFGIEKNQYALAILLLIFVALFWLLVNRS